MLGICLTDSFTPLVHAHLLNYLKMLHNKPLMVVMAIMEMICPQNTNFILGEYLYIPFKPSNL